MMIDCPTGLTADEIFAEIRRLYQDFKAIGGMQEHPPAATHDQQSVLIAQIHEWGERLKIVNAKKTTTTDVGARGRYVETV